MSGDDMTSIKKILLILFVILFFSNANAISALSKEILAFWFEQLVPSMFVSIVLIQILSSTSFFTDIAYGLKGLCKVLNVNQEGLGLIISCLLAGCPASVVLINDAYQKQRITEKMAYRLLYCSPVATVSFLIMNVGVQMFISIKAGLFLWLIQIASSLVLLFLTRNTPIIANPITQKTQKKHSVTSAIFQSGIIVFLIGGYLLIFQTLSLLINLFLPSSLENIMKIISEFSYGCFLISEQFNFSIAFVLINALCGFNGLCVHYQAISISELKLPWVRYVGYRIVQSLIASVISITVLPLLL